MAKSFAHLGEDQFWLVAEAEKGLRASEFFARPRYGEHFFWSHGVRAGFAGIAAKGAVAAVVATKIGQRQENFARVGDDAGLEALFGGTGGSKKFGQVIVMAADQAQCGIACNRKSGAQLCQHGIAALFRCGTLDDRKSHGFGSILLTKPVDG